MAGPVLQVPRPAPRRSLHILQLDGRISILHVVARNPFFLSVIVMNRGSIDQGIERRLFVEAASTNFALIAIPDASRSMVALLPARNCFDWHRICTLMPNAHLAM
jgi:hypothetical protein